jgi:hypothetical protein
MAAPKTHNSNEISVSFANLSLDSGRADGDFVTTEFNSELYTSKVGADGELTRSKTNDFSAKITIKLMSTSQGHKILLGLYNAARAEPNGGDLAPFQLRDRNGGLVEHAETAWIEKAPANAFGKEVGEREWILATDALVRDVE